MIERQSWDEHFLLLADLTATRSTCLKAQHGAVLVRDKRVISQGFNGAPEGMEHCCVCLRKDLPSGSHPEWCMAVHAEQNAIINAARLGVSTVSSIIYITDKPCILCTKMLINAGVELVRWHGGSVSPKVLFVVYRENVVKETEVVQK